MPSDPPKVFISYSWDSDEHKARVQALADRLRGEGVDVRLDQYEPAPEETLPRWMRNQIAAADFVVIVATETYARRFLGQAEPGEGRGVQWEGAILMQALYDAGVRNTRFVPTILEPADVSLLGTYLRDLCDGDARRRREVPLLDEDIEQGPHARRMMAQYATSLKEGPERQILYLMGLFDRPAEAAAVAALRAAWRGQL